MFYVRDSADKLWKKVAEKDQFAPVIITPVGFDKAGNLYGAWRAPGRDAQGIHRFDWTKLAPEPEVFPHITRACEDVVFTSVPLVKELIERITTRSGLRVSVDIIDKVYEAGRKSAEHLKSSLQIVADAVMPKWNCVVSPKLSS